MQFKTKPFDYQQKIIDESYECLLQNGYCFYDMDVGTGKTKTSLNTAEMLIENCFLPINMEIGEGAKKVALNISEKLIEKPGINTIMVICPKPLMSTWKEEIKKHTDIEWPVFVWKKSNVKKYLSSDLSKGSVCIINVESFSTKNEMLLKLMEAKCGTTAIVLLDESSKIKTSSALRTKNLIKLTENAKYKCCLTGTKITNSLLDIFTQFEFLKSNFFGVKWGGTLTQKFYMFRKRHAILEEKYGKGRTFKVVVGYKAINKLMEQIKPYTFSARKEECLKDLPEKLYQTINVEMNPDQIRVYQELKKSLMTEYAGQLLTVEHKMTLFMRFRQITGGYMPESGIAIGKNNPKIDVILSESDSIDKAIIWSCFRSDIEGIAKALNDEFWPECALPYYGEINQNDRDKNIESFRDDKNCRYLVCNPASAAFGLNLQFSNVSYFFNRPLSVEQNIQAEGRQHRSGQKNSVVYKDLICEGTIDERVKELLSNRQDLIKSINEMSIQDIYNLV